MPPIELEIQSDSEVESVSEADSDSDRSSYDDEDDKFEERQKKSGANEVKDLARGHTQRVRMWKIFVLVTMTITTSCVSAGAYYFLKKEENDDYHDSYQLFVSSIRDSLRNHVFNLEGGFRSMSQVISSDAKARGYRHPYYELPNFEVVAGAVRTQSVVEVITYSPILERSDDIPDWIKYTSRTDHTWLAASVDAAVQRGTSSRHEYDMGPFTPAVYNVAKNGTIYDADGPGPFSPLWLISPPPFRPGSVNFNIISFDFAQEGFAVLNRTRNAVFSRILVPEEFHNLQELVMTRDQYETYHNEIVINGQDHDAYSVYMAPVFVDAFDTNSTLVGFLSTFFTWDRYLVNLLPQGIRGIICVIRNTCGQAVSYELVGNRARYLGPGNQHDERYAQSEVVVPFSIPEQITEGWDARDCKYDFVLYASEDFERSYRSDLPIVITAVVGGAFAFLMTAFFVYDIFVQQRNIKVMAVAAKTNEIVASLFPEAVRGRLFEDTVKARSSKKNKMSSGANDNGDTMIKKFLTGDGELDNEVDEAEDFMYKSRPIADLYPETTIMFADIAGFTAWSSSRDPAQVFTLLETFYKAFDALASRKGIFKVETIGDCYVAVAGLPEPREDHAVVMCRFASECLERMNFLARKLEVHLGPDTTELEMRAGLHSGAVTAGVLRGVRSRFQLFGDTMNTASRMESTGQRGKIQISQDTADLLVAAGKMSWIAPREERVVAKGKGEMQTFWVNIGTTIDVSAFQDGMGSLDDSLSYEEGPFSTLSPKTTRLVLWNVEILLDMLRQIHVLRGKTTSTFREIIVRSEERHTTAYDEVEDVIQFPPYNGQAAEIDTDGVEIKPEVEQQLEDFISTIASMYIENPFHDFAHASHATMGVVKLLSSLVKAKPGEYSDVQNASYLIASNPLVQFAMVLSVICHDVDHPGASNAILLSEKSRMASVYGYKSVAEQNSLDLTWDLLMDDNYAELRAAIYRTEEEKQLFRQVLVNSVISTDLFDQRLKDRFESRWKVGFPNESHGDQGTSKNLQATLIMETMVQAADIAHTMQHWQVYRKWNLRLFEEMYQGFVDGRTSSDPSDFWFEGELQFYNNYTLPLVRRLRQSGAFVTASTDSHQDYAEQNKRQWENKGKDIVAEMVDATRAKITARMKEGPHGLDE